MHKKRLVLAQKEKITLLRRQGKSIDEISSLLSISKSSVFRYSKNIEIDHEYNDIWRAKRGGSVYRKFKKEKEAEDWAITITECVSERELLFVISSLYWGEGSKRDFEIINSDP